MLEIVIPRNDQSIYEIKTTSGKSYLVRCPGQSFPENDQGGMLAFLVEEAGERTVMLRDMSKISSFVRRTDLQVSEDAERPESMYDLLSRRPGQGARGFIMFHLD